ncbi:DUF1501 domain-containing protein [bacterium]|nr:DUF1501 domain-containing protein [bacterium]
MECNRRQLLKFVVQGGFALSFSQVLGVSTLFAGPAAKAKSCIVLWMAGGPSQLDTFDPKPGTSSGGEFKAISTAVDGIQISEHLPLLAKEMKDLAIIRSMTSKEGNHDRARYYVHTGYAKAGVTQHPSFGSIVAKELIEKSEGLPAYVSINGPAEGAGLLGVNFAPFVIRNPEKPPENLAYANRITRERFDDRVQLLDMVNSQFASTHKQEEISKKDAIYNRAMDLMNSPSLTAFDLEKEQSSVRDRYGRNKTGAAFLMARRLVEHGVKFVEVEMSGWDTHSDNFTETKALMQELDPAYSALISDLRESGLLQSTLIVWMGEFGRTPKINGKAGRDHWPQNWCAVVAGGGIRGGQIIGATDKTGASIDERAVSVPDLYATLCRCLAIDDSKYNSSPLGRPIRIVDKGNPITELI